MSIIYKALAFAGVGLVVLALYGKIETWQLLLTVEVCMLAYGMGRPVWVAGALVFSELTGPAVFIPLGGASVLSLRLVVSALALLLILPSVFRRDALGVRGWVMLGLALAFVLVATASNSANSLTADVTIKYARYLFTFLAILLVIPAAVHSRKDLEDLCWIAVWAATLSGVLTVMQHYHINGLHGFRWGRAPGFADHPVVVALVLSVAIAGVVTMLLTNRFRSPTVIAILALSAGFMTLGLYFTYTRTALLALATCPVVFLLYLRGKARTTVAIAMVIGMAVFVVTANAPGARITLSSFSFSADGSAAARPVLWKVATTIAKEHMWLGVGREGFRVLGPQYASVIDPASGASTTGAAGLLESYDPHNDFLYSLVAFGIFGFLLFTAFHVLAWMNFHAAWKISRDWLIRSLAVGGIAALVGYMANSSFHNSFDGSLLLGVMMGFSVTLHKLAKESGKNYHATKAVSQGG